LGRFVEVLGRFVEVLGRFVEVLDIGGTLQNRCGLASRIDCVLM
jgi:hypothetical protein